MLGDALDHTQDFADVLDLGTEVLDAVAGGAGGTGKRFDSLHALANHLLTAFDFVVGSLRGLCGLLSIACHVMHRRRHLIHGRGDLLGFFPLATDLQVGLFGDCRQRMSRRRQLLDTGLQAADNAAQTRAHLLHGQHQLADFIAAFNLHRRAQIAGRNLLGDADHAAQRCHDQASNDPGGDQTDQ